MEKVVKFLEQHVQWLVLGFAALFVAWAGYAYLYQKPLKVMVGVPPIEATPGEVDPLIKQKTADDLERRINDPKVEPPKVADVLAQFTRGISEDTVKEIVAVNWNAQTSGTHWPVGGDSSQLPGPTTPLVDHLPTLPPAMPDKQTARWTVIMVPAPGAAAPAPAVPGQAPAPAAQPVMLRRDVAYWSGTFKLDSAALTKQYTECFAKANLPLNAMNAEFVRVELLRQEKDPAGAWGKPTVIATLPIYDLMPYPGDKKPAPKPDELKRMWYEYKTWLEQNQDIIARPAFYQTAPDAEPWVLPGNEPLAAAAQPGAVAQRPYDPSRDVPRTDAERAQFQAYKQALLNAARERNSRLRPGGRTGRPGVGLPGGYPPVGGGGYPPVGAGPGMPNPGYTNPAGPSIPPYGPQTIPPGYNNAPPPFVNPNVGGNNGFNPGLAAGDPQILVHDVTIQEGHTYRYAVRYKLFNPMFDKPLLAKPAVAGKFDIDSPDPSDPAGLPKVQPPIVPEKLWTAEVTVEPLAHIFVQSIQWSSNQAEFVVYTWKDGKWHETTVKKKMPGDPLNVGTNGKEPTPWTVVDVRKDPHSNEAYVLLMDNKGLLIRRDVASDQADPQWEKLKAEAGTAVSASR